MLETLLLAAIVAAPVASASLFLPARLRARKPAAWSAIRRFVLAAVKGCSGYGWDIAAGGDRRGPGGFGLAVPAGADARPQAGSLVSHPPVRAGGGGHRHPGRGGGRGPEAARGVTVQPDRRDRGRGVRQPDLAAGDAAVERPRPPGLGIHRVPLHRLPRVRAGLDV